MSLEAEQAIVAGCIESERTFDTVAEALVPSDFSDPHCRLLFELVAKMRDAGKPVDSISMSVYLGRSARWSTLESADPVAYVEALVACSSSFFLVPRYIEIVKSAATARTLLDYCSEIAELAYDTSLTAEEKIAKAQAAMPQSAGDGGGFVSYYEAGKAAVEEISRRSSGELLGVSSGMSNVDEMTGGFEPSTLTILAGRPSHGKSLYGMQWAEAAAKTGPVLMFSLEMSAANLAMRGLSSLGSVDFGVMRTGRVDEHMVAGMQHALSEMQSMNLHIDDRGGISVDQLRSRARIMARREKPTMIVTDYLTLLSGVGENRTQQIGYVSRSLKAMAKELDCAVLCLAQVNRGVESRTDKRPTLGDLRESGEIEQDADVVAFTYLHEKYVPETQRKGYGELIFAKQRNGQTGSVFTEWQGRYQRFRPFTGEVPPEEPADAANDSGGGHGMSDFVGKRRFDGIPV